MLQPQSCVRRSPAEALDGGGCGGGGIHLGDLSTFVVPAEDGDAVGVPHLGRAVSAS